MFRKIHYIHVLIDNNVKHPRLNGIIIITSIITLGVLASICVIVTAFSLSRKIILWSMMITSFLTGTQFILLGEAATTFLIAVSALYSILLLLENKIPFVRGRVFTVGVLAIQVAGYFVINGFAVNWSLLALLGTIVGTFSMWFQDPMKLKASMLVLGGIWMTYQIASGAYGQVPGEVVFLTGIITSLVLLTKAKRQGIPLETVEEMPTMLRRKFKEWKSAQAVLRQEQMA